MSQIVYGIMRDLGDGSAVLDWYTDREYVNYLLTSDKHCE